MGMQTLNAKNYITFSEKDSGCKDILRNVFQHDYQEDGVIKIELTDHCQDASEKISDKVLNQYSADKFKPDQFGYNPKDLNYFIVKSLIKCLDGSVDVFSIQNHGNQFHIWIPAKAEGGFSQHSNNSLFMNFASIEGPLGSNSRFNSRMGNTQPSKV